MIPKKTVGIIAEYNPFHNGHLYHLNETKKRGQAECIVAVMSGCFTQRGEPAIADKWLRAAAAVENGVDLVLELPFIFACNNAEYFAKGAMRLLDGLGCIDSFSFGSERGNLEDLLPTAQALQYESDTFRENLAFYLDAGHSYPRARCEAVEATSGSRAASVLKDPNNILGVEYLKEWLHLESNMTPMTIRRAGAGHNDQTIGSDISSATSIRRELVDSNSIERIDPVIPEATRELLKTVDFNGFAENNSLFSIAVYKILNTSAKSLSNILSAGEGLENRLQKAAECSVTYEDLVQNIKTKRYTETRIRRLLIHTLLDLRKDDFFRILEAGTLYARVLGLSKRGGELLKRIKKTQCAKIPVITNIHREETSDESIKEMLDYDIRSADLYHLIYNGSVGRESDHRQKPYVQRYF